MIRRLFLWVSWARDINVEMRVGEKSCGCRKYIIWELYWARKLSLKGALGTVAGQIYDKTWQNVQIYVVCINLFTAWRFVQSETLSAVGPQPIIGQEVQQEVIASSPFFVWAAQEWISVPSNIREMETYCMFRAYFKKFLWINWIS